MTRWTTLIPLLGPMLTAAAIDRLPAHLEPQGSGFLARTGQRTYLLTETGALRFSPRAVMTFVGANPAVHAEPMRRLPGKTNYLRGSDPARWRTGVPQFGGVRYASLYPGVDLIYHADSGLEYDLEIAPRVSPSRIVMEFSGADRVHLSRDGGLLVHAGDGELKFGHPRISQDGRDVRGGYRLVGPRRAVFWIGDYDHTRRLLIDPVVVAFGTLVTSILAVAADAAGNVYVAGNSTGTVPTVNALQPNIGTGNCSPETNVLEACQDVYVAKLDPTATQILYWTYLGDNGMDWFGGLAVDAQGNAYFAATAYPAQAFFGHQPSGIGHAFVRKLSPDGSALLYDKSLGANTQAGAVALDVSGNAYLTGTSFSASFPAVHALQPQPVVTPIFVTRDGGASWNPVHMPAPTVTMLAIAPGSSATLYAAASVGLLKTIDGGTSWTNLIPTAIAATVVVLDPKTPSTVYTVYSPAASGSLPSQSVLARSLDAGATWSILSGIPLGFLNHPAPVTGLAVDPENSSALWIAVSNTVGGMIDKSVDAGASWLTAYSPAVKPPPFPIGPTTVAVNPTDSAHVYTCCVGQPGAVEGSSLLSTKDGGATWTAGAVAPVHSFALDPSNPLVLYAAASTGLDKSSDSGVSWSTVNLPPPGYSSNVLVSATGVVYGANDDGAFFRSADHGSTWSVTKGPFGSGAAVLAIDPAAPATVYVGSPQSQIQDAFAAKLDSAGNTVWATLLGGSGSDSGQSIAVDVKGNVYLAGTTNSSDFPVLNAVQSTLGQVLANTTDAFVAEISADGSALVYSTYLGTEVENAVVAVNAGGEAFVAGITGTSSFPLVNPMFSASGTTYTEFGYGGGFVAKIAAGGGKLTFSTYFPANPVALSVDSAGEPWLAGQYGVQLPMVQPIQPSAGNGFLAHLNSPGSALLFSTFLCGSVSSLSLAPSGSVWVAGGACYNDFPNIGSAATNGPVGYVARIDAAPPAARAGVPRIDGVYNAGGYQWGNAVAPGEVVTLLGAELASSTVSAAGGRLPTSLSDVTVTVGGISAPLYYVSPGQINFQAPTNLTLGAADLVVTRSTAITHRAVNVVAMQAGIFFVNGVPAVTHASDFSQVTASNPAHPGEYLTVFCSGLGLTTPVVPAGQVSPLAPIVAPGYISIGTGAEVLFQYAGLSPGSTGLYQINFQLPANSVVGLTDLFLSISYQSTTDVPLYVK